MGRHSQRCRALPNATARLSSRDKIAELLEGRLDDLVMVPRDVNIVLERTDDEPFDLIIATNVLVYDDMFEQSLALANVARMLRTGGFFLTNYAVSPLPPSLVTPVFWDRQRNGDTLFWYQRR